MDIHRCRFVDYIPHTITASAFSHQSTEQSNTPNDLRLAVGRSNGDVEIWNPKNGWVHELTLPGSSGRSIEGLVWSTVTGDQARLFTIGGSTFITEWDFTSGKPKTNYDCNAGIIWSIDVSHDQKLLVVGCDDGSVVIIDISGGVGSLEHGIICQRQDARVLSIKWCGDSLIGGCSDGQIRSWFAGVGETRGRITGTMKVDKSKTESTLVWSIAVLPGKKQIVSGDSTGSVKIWDLELHTLLQTFDVHDADVLCLSVDHTEESFFSAGVDRKIHQFNLITQSKSASKWVHSFNRLLHSNDIRAMSIYTSKSHDFLITGGVERSLVVQSTAHFHSGKYIKISINQQKSNLLVNDQERLVVMWQDQTVKIWKILEGGVYKLVSKLSLSEEENITSASINEDASLLVVSRLTSVRVFHLTEVGEKLKVTKFRDENFDSLVAGAKLVKLYNINKLLVLTPDEEIYKFDINELDIVLDDEIELLDTSYVKSLVQHFNCINSLVISPDASTLVISRHNGSIEQYPLSTNTAGSQLTKISSYPHLIKFSSNTELLCVTNENKIYEFSLVANTLLTSWSRKNTENLPNQFLDRGVPQGLFVQDSKIWCYGSNWITFFDKDLDLPAKKMGSKKRSRNGKLVATEKIEEDDDEDSNSEDEKILDKESFDKSYRLISKYSNIMKVEDFGGSEIIVFERPQDTLPVTPTFNLVKFKF